MIKIAVLGFGKVGQSVVQTVQQHPLFRKRFEVAALWNRTTSAFDQSTDLEGIRICESLPDLLTHLPGIDLVVECSHPSIIRQYALDILAQTDLFVSSPTAFADREFRRDFFRQIKTSPGRCYLPLGASIGVWEVIRLDRDQQLKSLRVTMKKEPDAFKVSDPAVLAKLSVARQSAEPVTLSEGLIDEINQIAPQNTNTMSIYALAASSLGFEECRGEMVADRDLDAHLVELMVETKGGLKLSLLRDNPAGKGQVTGSATFGSFLNSLYHFREGIDHGCFTFC